MFFSLSSFWYTKSPRKIYLRWCRASFLYCKKPAKIILPVLKKAREIPISPGDNAEASFLFSSISFRYLARFSGSKRSSAFSPFFFFSFFAFLAAFSFALTAFRRSLLGSEYPVMISNSYCIWTSQKQAKIDVTLGAYLVDPRPNLHDVWPCVRPLWSSPWPPRPGPRWPYPCPPLLAGRHPMRKSFVL